MRVLFGHQSVGDNILEGLRIVAANAGTIVSIGDIHGTTLPAGRSLLAHFRVGKNGDPTHKLNDFVRAVDARKGDGLDLALFKFCYVDLVDERLADDLFTTYARGIEALRSRAGDTDIGHVTVPLQALRTGPRAALRRLLKIPDNETARNAARHRFNERLRSAYGGTDLLFDLATIESTPTGAIGSQPYSKTAAPALLAAYTHDRGHLNSLGQAVVATAFERFLDAVRSRRRGTYQL